MQFGWEQTYQRNFGQKLPKLQAISQTDRPAEFWIGRLHSKFFRQLLGFQTHVQTSPISVSMDVEPIHSTTRSLERKRSIPEHTLATSWDMTRPIYFGSGFLVKGKLWLLETLALTRLCSMIPTNLTCQLEFVNKLTRS